MSCCGKEGGSLVVASSFESSRGRHKRHHRYVIAGIKAYGLRLDDRGLEYRSSLDAKGSGGGADAEDNTVIAIIVMGKLADGFARC